jgi:sulfofructose kinase
MSDHLIAIDVLCIGHASYDLIFSISHHPAADEKLSADQLIGCGGGPAANAAITVAKLGLTSAFAGYLGLDVYGDSHFAELEATQVDTRLIVRDRSPTPLSTILVKPDGKRALINYKGNTQAVKSDRVDFSPVECKVCLFDGHEPELALAFLQEKKTDNAIPSILDAGSLHEGTRTLMHQVNYLVASEKFAQQYAGDAKTALTQLAEQSPVVVITLGERGLIWQRGDAFHGACAAAIANHLPWQEVLHYASAAGACCCQKMGARIGIPSREEHQALLKLWQSNPASTKS